MKDGASSSLIEDPIVDDGDAKPITVDVSLGHASSAEAWYEEEGDDLDMEWKLRRDKHYTAGYREGLLQGQSDAAQEGFNEGFKESVMVGYKWGLVRGITSALAHIPDDLKIKLVEDDNIRRELLNLHKDVASIGTDDALKLYYEDLQRPKSEEQSGSVKPGTSLINRSGSVVMKDYFGKLEFLLKESPAIDAHFKLDGNVAS